MYGYNPYMNSNSNYFSNYQQKPDERIWVQNEISAEAYLVAPNGFVRLWDANQPVFYERRADANGKPLPMESFKYERIPTKNESLVENGTIDYQKQIDGILGRISALEKEINHDSKSNANATDVQSIQE